MKVYIEREDKEVELKRFKGTVLGLLTKLKINPYTVVVEVNNDVKGFDYELSDKDKVKVLDVITGG